MAITVVARPFEKCFSGNTIHYELYSAVAAADTAASFEVQVLFKQSNGADFSVLATLPYNPFNGTAIVEISAILHSLLQYGVPPLGNESAVYPAPQQSGWFYIKFREITAANTNPDWDASEADYVRFVLKGGLDIFRYEGNNFWVNYWEVKKPFLTWQRSGRLAALTERMYLAFLNDDDTANLKLRISVMYTDGSGATVDNAVPGTGFVVHYIPAGAVQWNLVQLNEQKDIWYWTLQLLDFSDVLAPVPVSDTYRYYADNRNDYNQTTLHYRGSLGSFDSVRIRGVIEPKAGYQHTEQQRAMAPGYYDGSYITPSRVITGGVEQLSWKGNTGDMKHEDMERLRDAQIIREAWWEQSGKWWPVVITTPDFSLPKSDAFRFNMPIEWQLAHTGSPWYTPKNMDLGSGVFTANVCQAFISDIDVQLQDSLAVPGHKKATITFTEQDPQNASEMLQYRSFNDTEQFPWLQHNYTPIEIFVLNEKLTTLEIQAICQNGVLGKKVSYTIDTRTPAPPPDPGDGGGTPPPPLKQRLIYNNTNRSTHFTIRVDGTAVSSGTVGARQSANYLCPDLVNQTLEVDLDFTPGSVLLTGDLTRSGLVTGSIVTFSNVTSSNFTIVIY